jgi:hypothetical protein
MMQLNHNLDQIKHNAAPYSRMAEVLADTTIDRRSALQILKADLSPRFTATQDAITQSWDLLLNHSEYDSFLFHYVVLCELASLYPLTQHNWDSNDRVPLLLSSEATVDAVTLAFQGHYLAAFSQLYNVLQLALLQLYLLPPSPPGFTNAWLNSEKKIPHLSGMLKNLQQRTLFIDANRKLHLTRKVQKLSTILNRELNQPPQPVRRMGLTGQIFLKYDAYRLSHFLKIFCQIAHGCLLLVASFFPNAVIPLPGFEKLGHLDPVWIPRRSKISCIRSVLAEDELTILEQLALQNEWFQNLSQRLNALPTLTAAEIHATYKKLQDVSEKSPSAALDLLKASNQKLEI